MDSGSSRRAWSYRMKSPSAQESLEGGVILIIYEKEIPQNPISGFAFLI